jgi:hypothetical protein
MITLNPNLVGDHRGFVYSTLYGDMKLGNESRLVIITVDTDSSAKPFAPHPNNRKIIVKAFGGSELWIWIDQFFQTEMEPFMQTISAFMNSHCSNHLLDFTNAKGGKLTYYSNCIQIQSDFLCEFIECIKGYICCKMFI